MLDEESIRMARTIMRKEKAEERKKRSAYGAANEINMLAIQIDELSEALNNFQCENNRLKKYIGREKKEGRRNKRIADAVFKVLGRAYLPDDEKRLSEYLSSSDDFKIFMNSKFEKEDLFCNEK